MSTRIMDKAKVGGLLKSSAKWSAEAFGEGGMKLSRRKKRKSFAKWPKRIIVGVARGCMPMMMWQLAHRRKDRSLGSCEVRS